MALVGANGAGKSTLIKILTGYYDSYEGRIEIDGQGVQIHQPNDAARVGIQAVYQEVDSVLVPSLTISENLLMNQLVTIPNPLLSWSALHRQAEAVLAQVGLDLDVRRRVEDLVLHEKQMLVIARAVSQQVKYLIFDEPTTSLSLPEVERPQPAGSRAAVHHHPAAESAGCGYSLHLPSVDGGFGAGG